MSKVVLSEDRPLGPAELDVARGTWRRVRRPGVRYVDAGQLPDGTVELLGTDGPALDALAAALCMQGTPVRRTQLPHPTERDVADLFRQAHELAAQRTAMLPAGNDADGGLRLAFGIIGGGLALLLGVKVVKGLLR
jgi:hypothetical protein